MTEPWEKLEAKMRAMPLENLSDAARRRILGQLEPRRRMFPVVRWIARGAAAAAIVCLAWGAIHFLGNATQPPQKPPGTIVDVEKPPAVTLASDWLVVPTGKADYKVVDPHLVRLSRGELMVESAPSAGPVSPIRIETAAGTASVHGTKFFIGTHELPIDVSPTNNEGEPMTQVAKRQLTRILVLSGVVMLANLQGSISGGANQLLAAEPGKAPVNYAAAANSDFGFDFYRQLTNDKNNDGKNMFFSPYSMSAALAMTAEGARGKTAQEMGNVLRFPGAAKRVGNDAQLIPWNVAMIHTGIATVSDRLNADSKQYELRVANSLWGEQTYPFSPTYLGTINKYYKTGGIFSVDFLHEFEAARKKINAWVESTTNQRIKDILPKGAVDNSTCLVLVNAIYFKGQWHSRLTRRIPRTATSTWRRATSPGLR